MKNKHTFYMGLKYPNALFFGILFIGIVIYGIYDLLTDRHMDSGAALIIQLVFIGVALLFGSLSLSFKSIKVDIQTNKIIVCTNYCLVFPSSETYDLSEIRKIKIKQAKANYSAGGGMLATAQQSFSVKETNMFFYSSAIKPYFTLENVSAANKSKLVDFFTTQLKIELIEK